MKRTVTLDEDVEQLLRDAIRRTGQSFQQTINAAMRAGLSGRSIQSGGPRFVVKARPLGLRAGLYPASLNKLVDTLETEAALAKSYRRSRR
jgi:hypothetical protein